MFLTKSKWLRLNDYTSSNNIPLLPCPYCFNESLVMDVESISMTESAEHICNVSVNRSITKAKKDIEKIGGESAAWKILMAVAMASNGEKITPGIFSSILHCQTCGGVVCGIGSAKYRSTKNNLRQTVTIKHEYFCPSIPFFQISTRVPERITQELLQAFNYFHSDISTAGFKLRRAMEKICEDLGYTGKNLHQCIELMSEKHAEEAAWLKALKLVGNEATHADGVTASDLLDSFEVFPGILDIFERRHFSKNASEKVESLQNKFGKK